MRPRICLSPIVLAICAAIYCVSNAFGQSLSIVKRGETNYWIEASAPVGNLYTLQASENLHLWIDITNGIQGTYSFPFGNPNIALRYFRLISTPPPAPPIRVMILSDSMGSDCCGWGGGVYGFFKPEAMVINYAMAWTSTRIFLQSPEKDNMMLVKPNYVLMEYGFIDGAGEPDRSVTMEQFAINLKTIVEMVRSFNGVPILLTLHAARLWDENGRLVQAWNAQNTVIRTVAKEVNTPLIDLYDLTYERFDKLGPEGCEFMRFTDFGPGDFMHLSKAGAEYVSRLIVSALPGELGPYLTGIFDPLPTP